MNSNSCYAFYGSLRRGMFNYKLYERHLQYLSTEKIPGFRLYSLKEYPIAVKSNLDSEKICVEIMKIVDRSTEREIHEMELAAGYYYDEVFLNDSSVGIYLFREPGEYPLVESGDWVKFLAQKD